MNINAMAIKIGSVNSTRTGHMIPENIKNLRTLTVTEPLDSYDEIENALRDTDIVFICTELEDPKAILSVPIIVKIAKAVKALTVSLVIKPSYTEEVKENEKVKAFEDLIEILSRESDAVFIISKDTMWRSADLREANKDYKTTTHIISALLEVLANGKNDINLDLSDLKLVMQGKAFIGIGTANGDNSWQKAIHDAIDALHLDKQSIRTTKSILVHFKMHPDYQLIWLNESIQVIVELTDEDVDIMFGTTTDGTLAKDAISITVIACNGHSSMIENSMIKNNIDFEGSTPQ